MVNLLTAIDGAPTLTSSTGLASAGVHVVGGVPYGKFVVGSSSYYLDLATPFKAGLTDIYEQSVSGVAMDDLKWLAT